ncbi:protein-L-isoaspartate O-methyltransferase 1-like isoform X1 [Primulina huaijiensis]|uniref:protein-L-isoaspartate O-methyltransferase 1-like isoform X1 n=4 Tax=Primulina huaijiensis TaxID=1492673 RepID=UPI003CC76C62
MHSTSHSLIIAWGCRYRAPIKLSSLYLTPLLLHHRRRTRELSPPPVAVLNTSTITSGCRLLNPHFTGNSLFSRMEILMRGMVLLHLISMLFYISKQRIWTGSCINKNNEMLDHLQRYGVIKSKKTAEVMKSIDRALFVPEGTPPYVDSPVQIGYNVTISAPHMHATCLELLENNLKPGMHALDVGSGTGYLTACFAVMVGPQGRAVGVEHIPELVDSSIVNIQRSAAAQLQKEGILSLHAGDGRLGWPQFAPYDAIHVGAAASEIPEALIEQLKPGGRLVIPVGNVFQDLKVVDKNMDGSLSVRSETSVRYVPLTSREAQLRGD